MLSSSSPRSAESATVAFEAVATLDQAQEVRALRNQCRAQMTRNPSVLTEKQQQEWFGASIAPGKVLAWLLRIDGAAAAYAILRPAKPSGWWMSCGVAENARGRGLGTLIVRLVTTAGLDRGSPVRLEVWSDNTPARRAYQKCGYTVTGTATRGGRPFVVMEAR